MALRPKIHSKIKNGLLSGKTPKSIFVHIGGNNVTNTHTCKIIRLLKREIQYLIDNFEHALVVWTFILPRLTWGEKSDPQYIKKMNDKRMSINRTLSKVILSFKNGRSLNIKSIDTNTHGFFYKDGIHLSQVGKEMYILAISDTTQQLFKSSQKHFEM